MFYIFGMAKAKLSILKGDLKKPVWVEFERSDGSIARFKAQKVVTKPTKVTFYRRKKIEKFI